MGTRENKIQSWRTCANTGKITISDFFSPVLSSVSYELQNLISTCGERVRNYFFWGDIYFCETVTQKFAIQYIYKVLEILVDFFRRIWQKHIYGINHFDNVRKDLGWSFGWHQMPTNYNYFSKPTFFLKSHFTLGSLVCSGHKTLSLLQ